MFTSIIPELIESRSKRHKFRGESRDVVVMRKSQGDICGRRSLEQDTIHDSELRNDGSQSSKVEVFEVENDSRYTAAE